MCKTTRQNISTSDIFNSSIWWRCKTIFKIEKLLGDNLLAQKVEAQPPSEFDDGRENKDDYRPIYTITHAGPDSRFKVDQLVILKPRTYENIEIELQTYIVLTDEDVLGLARKAKDGK